MNSVSFWDFYGPVFNLSVIIVGWLIIISNSRQLSSRSEAKSIIEFINNEIKVIESEIASHSFNESVPWKQREDIILASLLRAHEGLRQLKRYSLNLKELRAIEVDLIKMYTSISRNEPTDDESKAQKLTKVTSSGTQILGALYRYFDSSFVNKRP